MLIARERITKSNKTDPRRLQLVGLFGGEGHAKRAGYRLKPTEFDQQADPPVLAQLVVLGHLPQLFGVREAVIEAAAGAAGFSVIAGPRQATSFPHLFDRDVSAGDLGLQEGLERPAASICAGHDGERYARLKTGRLRAVSQQAFRISEPGRRRVDASAPPRAGPVQLVTYRRFYRDAWNIVTFANVVPITCSVARLDFPIRKVVRF